MLDFAVCGMGRDSILSSGEFHRAMELKQARKLYLFKEKAFFDGLVKKGYVETL